MKPTLFETRQRADEMIRQATSIWQRSAFSEQLEELGKDPVFTLLMTALAYQAYEMDSEIERIKQEVIEDMTRTLIPYELLYAIPATTVIEAKPAKGIQQLDINADTRFTLIGTKYNFIPLCRSKLLSVQIKSFSRLDGRRWKVGLVFDEPIDNISGFCFAIRDAQFRDISVSVGGKTLPLVRPSDYAQLPFDPAFGINTMLYNNMHAHIAATACSDLFARQNTQLFYVQQHADNQYYPTGLEKMELIIEFSGISDTFAFTKSNLVLNSILLVNATIHTATLSPERPIVRAVGGDNKTGDGEQFMHLVCPAEDQLYGDSTIEVRYSVADRFNQGSLLRLIGALKAKYHTDYRAFSELSSEENDAMVQQLSEGLIQMEDNVRRQTFDSIPGVYLLLRQNRMDKQGSVDIRYLTTPGSAINDILTPDSLFTTVDGVAGTSCAQVAEPIMGRDERTDFVSGVETARYLVATGDRIVTPADIRLFCYKELQIHYGITREMVQQISVSNRLSNDRQGVGYEIVVEIQITASSYALRDMEEKKTQIENLLQRSMGIRSTNIYPICVSITLNESGNDAVPS